jgi:NAD(P)-dependent dehydrogenase (short-subunit alcohol dehydrogenase family)
MATWLVTGANRGIGLGLARALGARGDAVIAGVRDPASAGALRALGARVEVVPLDVADARSVAAAAAAVGGRPIDVLVNNAGVYGPKRQGAFDLDPDAFLATLAVNSVGPFRVLQAFRRNLGRGAKVVTISSTMGSFERGGAGYAAYRASKAAVNRAVAATAGELAGHGIVSVVMHPGWVRTDMGGAGADLSVEESATGILRTIDGLGAADAGRFFEWDGRRAPW